MMAENWRARGLVLYLLIARLTSSTHGMSNRWDIGRHESPLLITAHPQKRDATICPTDYSLCPSSLSGGCCPTDLSCGVSSCYPTTAPPPTECSMSGYIACGIDQGGGCCPGGYSCAINGCLAPLGSSYSQDCGASSYLCPSSVGYGCCHNNLACGVGYCYQTSFSSVFLTITFTTTISSSITQTRTTVVQTAYTESVPQTVGTAAAAASSTITKFTPSATAVAKLAASEPPSSGLTQVQLGGIIGAAVVVVLAVCVATFLILRRLNAVAREAKASALRNSRSGSSRPRPQGPTPSGGSGGYSGIENISIDPLIMTSDSSANPSHSNTGLPRPSAVYSARNDFEPGTSPPIPAPYASPHGWSGGYQQVPMSEPPHSDGGGGHGRHQSIDSPGRSLSPQGAAGGGGGGGYFDHDPALRDQNLRYGQRGSRPSVQSHGRQWSDASNVSQESENSGIVKLDAGPDGDRRNSLQRAMQGGVSSTTRATGRRKSGERRRRSSSGGSGIRWDTAVAPGMSPRLENVQESELDSRIAGFGFSGAGAGVTEQQRPEREEEREQHRDRDREPEKGKEQERDWEQQQQEREREKRQGYGQGQGRNTGGGFTGGMPPPPPPPLSTADLDRLEQQKVMGNLFDIRREPR